MKSRAVIDYFEEILEFPESTDKAKSVRSKTQIDQDDLQTSKSILKKRSQVEEDYDDIHDDDDDQRQLYSVPNRRPTYIYVSY